MKPYTVFAKTSEFQRAKTAHFLSVLYPDDGEHTEMSVPSSLLVYTRTKNTIAWK